MVCDDLFFSRYRRESSATTTLGDGSDHQGAAQALLEAMYGEAYTEEDKAGVVDQLLDVKLLEDTDNDGTMLSADRISQW